MRRKRIKKPKTIQYHIRKSELETTLKEFESRCRHSGLFIVQRTMSQQNQLCVIKIKETNKLLTMYSSPRQDVYFKMTFCIPTNEVNIPLFEIFNSRNTFLNSIYDCINNADSFYGKYDISIINELKKIMINL